MKKSFKLLTTGTLAAALLFSGSALSASKAFADEATAETASLQSDSFASQLINYHLSILAKDAAQATGQDEDDIRDALAAGQTLPEATGVSSADLLADLTPILTFDIHKAFGYGLISSDEVQAGETAVAYQLNSALEMKGNLLPTADSNATFAHLVMSRLDNIVRDTANYGRKDQKDVKDDLLQGKTLVQSAARLDPGELKNDLLNLLKDDLQYEVNMYGASQADANRFYSLGASKLAEFMNTPGYNPDTVKQAAADLGKIVDNRLNRAVIDTAFFARKDQKDVWDGLQQGKSLVAIAANLDPGELKDKVTAVLRQDLNFQITLGLATQEDANKAYADGAAKLSVILNTPGYSPAVKSVSQADLQQVVQTRIERIINDTAVFGKKDEKDVLSDLRDGKTLVESAAKLDPGKLKEKVLNVLRQDLDFQVSLNRATQEEANKAYADGAAKLTEIMNTPGYTPATSNQTVDLQSIINNRINRVINDTAVFGSKEEKDVLADLSQGKTLVESAAKLDPGKLKEKVLNVLRQELDFQVSLNHTTKEDADKAYADGSAKLVEILNTPGYTPSK